MSTTIQQHLKESVLKTALYHQPAAGNGLFTYENLLLLINNYSMEDCLNMIIDQLI